MRSAFAFVVAALSLCACASHRPPQAAQSSEVPMYTHAEWSQMNADNSIPELDPMRVEEPDLSTTEGRNGSPYHGAVLPSFRGIGTGGAVPGISGSGSSNASSAPAAAPASAPAGATPLGGSVSTGAGSSSSHASASAGGHGGGHGH